MSPLVAPRTGRVSFIGVTTGSSAIMSVFPRWARLLALGDVVMTGYDLPLHAGPRRYREVVAAIRSDPVELGGLVTTHKIDLFRACRDMFDYIDPYATLCGEVSCLSKRDGRFRAHAKDPVASGRALDEFVRPGHWQETGAEALLLGAGGANLAISLHLLTVRPRDDRPRRILVIDQDPARLEALRAIHDRLKPDIKVDYVHSTEPRQNDLLLTGLPPESLVVNGTGMGKDIPGSPISDEALFPKGALVWELNYRGELDFLHQAQRQRKARGLTISDGWRYFIYGWTSVIEEVFNLKMEARQVRHLAETALKFRSDPDSYRQPGQDDGAGGTLKEG